MTPHQGALPARRHTEPSQPPEGEYSSAALLGAPVSLGIVRQAGEPGREMAAELAGWSSGELPGQASEQLAGWPSQLAPSSMAVPQQAVPQQAVPQQAVPPLAVPPLAPPGLTAAAEQSPPGAA